MLQLLILIIGLGLLGLAVTMVLRAFFPSAGHSTDALDQIGAYGYAGALPEGDGAPRRSFLTWADDLASSVGAWVGEHFSSLKPANLRARLISAGMYDVTPERVLGYKVALPVVGTILWLWLAGLAGVSALWLVVVAILVAVVGWILPTAIIDRRARIRRERIEKDLPDLIDLIVVSLEAGLSFPQSMRMAAAKVKEPLASEMRLTLQEQNMGLTLVEALENFLRRIDTQGVRMFARSISQGETLGVSTGQIMRNLAVELRKRRKAYAEERAQKAPVKILFPLLFLIMPALFIVLLLPVMIRIMDVL
jgi:tight adherence protein C